MQACARIGAVHSVVFGGFSSNRGQRPHRGRRREARDYRRWRLARRPPHRTQARGRQGAGRRLSDGANVIVYAAWAATARCAPAATTGGRTRCRERARLRARMGGCGAPLFLLYTSGSTGKTEGNSSIPAPDTCSTPRPVRNGHSTSRTTTVFWCTADVGWLPDTPTLCTGRWRRAARF